MVHTPAEDESFCDVEVGTHPPPYWKDNNSGLVVCTRHKAQYEERADEFGPYDWEEFVPVKEEEEARITSVVLDGIWLDNLMRQINDIDFCVVCDNHPSHGHAAGCPVKNVKED